jgi:hypothetical protein
MMKNNNNFLKVFGIIALIFMFSCSGNQKKTESEADQPVEAEVIDDGMVSIFNGENLDGWKRYNKDDIGPLWQVQDGMIFFNGSGLGEGSGEDGGTLITVKQYENFEFSVDWKIQEGGNSGLLYHVVEKPEFSHAYNTGPEYQLLDDNNWHDPGEKVLEFDEGSEDWQKRYENSKWVEYPGWCKYKKGSLGLQDHGANLWFKNIKAKEL